MSPLCVEAAYRYSHEKSQPAMLIASRRQVECASLGHGYVNNWTTEQFVQRCKDLAEKYPSSRIFLCRDHGGPWQGISEDSLGLEEAMERALQSYEADIRSGFDLLHIDPSLCKDGNQTMKTVLENTVRLLRACSQMASETGRNINYEIGTEENSGTITTMESFGRLASGIGMYCAKEGIEKPLFIVGQTQSLVKEMRQIGELNERNTKLLMEEAAKHGMMLKEHNADYLTEYQYAQRIRLEVPALNVAPEFGVFESQAIVDFCMKNGNVEEARQFLRLAMESGKWRKWVINPDTISSYDKSIICGHYVFAKPEFEDILSRLDRKALESEILLVHRRRLDFYFGRWHR
jgi:pentatricopeptide repeat protein